MSVELFSEGAFKPEKWDVRRHLVRPEYQYLWVGMLQYIPFWEPGGVYKEARAEFIEDVSGNQRRGRFVGNAHYVSTTKEGRGLQRDTQGGFSDYCDLSGIDGANLSGWLPTTQITVLHKHKVTGALVNACGFGLRGGGFSNRCGTNIPFSGKIYWDFGGVAEGVTRLSKVGTPDDDVWVFTAGPRGMEIWRDGELWASNAATPGRIQNSALPFGLGGAGDVWQAPGRDTAFGVGDRQMAASEIVTLSRDPWAPVRQDQIAVAAGAAGPGPGPGGGVALSSGLAINTGISL